MNERPSFFARFVVAFLAYWRILFDAEFATGVFRLRRGELPPPREEPAEAPAPEPPRLEERAPDAAMLLLGILQREGRFIDFLEEEIAGFSDQEVGAAARVVHEGCRQALHEHFELAPVRAESEGARVTIDDGFDAHKVRLTGNVVGQPPFHGTLQHRGWRVTESKLPKIAEEHDVSILTPAEVEL